MNTRFVEAGYLASFSAGRMGRRTSSPPQLGHLKWSFESAQLAQNVHSNVQMKACLESGGRSASQQSQPGLSSSIDLSLNAVQRPLSGGRLQRCGQPGQQHGLRIPPRILSRPTSMRRFRVSSFLAEVTQQIHSFRASGVMVAQRPFAAASDSMALRKSAGSLWIVPLVIALAVILRLSIG